MISVTPLFTIIPAAVGKLKEILQFLQITESSLTTALKHFCLYALPNINRGSCSALVHNIVVINSFLFHV